MDFFTYIYGTVLSSAKAWAKFYTRLQKTQGRGGSRAFPVQTFILTKQLGQSNSCFHFFLLRRVVEQINQVLFIDTPLLIFLSMTFYLHWGKIKLKKKDVKFGRPTHHLKTNKSCLGPGEISYGNNFWEDDFIKFEAGRFFVGKTDSEGGPKTTSMCFVMITYNDLTEFLSMIFPNGIYHLEKRKKRQSSWS